MHILPTGKWPTAMISHRPSLLLMFSTLTSSTRGGGGGGRGEGGGGGRGKGGGHTGIHDSGLLSG